jgi:hypothetical protein
MEQHRRRFPHLGRPGLGVGPGKGVIARGWDAPCRAQARACGAATFGTATCDTAVYHATSCDAAAGGQAAAAP